MKIHLVFCIRFGTDFSWILTSFLGHFLVKICEKPLPTGLRKINEFWRPYFPHFWWILFQNGGPAPPRKITIFPLFTTFYPKMEMSGGIGDVFKGLAWIFTIFGWFRENFYRIFHEFLKVSNCFFECFFCEFCNYFWLFFCFVLYFHWFLLMLARPRTIILWLGRPKKISIDR